MQVAKVTNNRSLQLVSQHELFQHLSLQTEELGFKFFSIALRSPLPLSQPRQGALSNYPESWQHAYVRNNYFAIDPVVQHALHFQSLLVWSDEVFAGTPEFWNTAQAAGLRFGLSQPTRGVHGSIGLLSLARPDRAISPAELEDNKFKLAWLAQTAHFAMSQHLLPDYMPATQTKLSSQEVAVLRWIAEGKTSAEVADILKLAERTVNFHINNANTKLGTNNRTAAAVSAALLGLL